LKTGFYVEIDGNIYEEDDQMLLFTTQEEAEVAAQKIKESWASKGVTVTTSVGDMQNTKKVQTAYYVIDQVDAEGNKTRAEGTFKSKDAAEEFAAKLNAQAQDSLSFSVSPVLSSKEESSQIAQVYFLKDTAKLINLLLAKDPLRNGKFAGVSGNRWMDLKNMQTSIEFAFSLFHAMTIAQEASASYASWHNLTNKGKTGLGNRLVAGFNPNAMMKESREIAAILESSLSDKDVASNEKTHKRLAELLRTDDANAMELIQQYYLVGGLLGQDQSLRHHVHDLGHGMRYTKQPDVVKIINGEPVYFPATDVVKGLPGMIKESFASVHQEALAKEPNKKIKAMFQVAKFGALESSTAWLMEYSIPRIKMSMWAREYTLGLERNKAKIDAGVITKEKIAHDAMLFIEDRFGEVNWQNNWLKPWMKTALQFLFRSFTWFTGSYKAYSKAGIDYAKLGWFKIKGEEYELTEHGWWAVNAFIAHVLTGGIVTLGYMAAVGLSGEEVPDDEDTPWLTKLLFPRVDRFDPESRVTIPSYVTEAYKIMRHTGNIGNEPDLLKLVTGRFNSLIGRSWEALITGEDWRGVSITNDEDMAVVRASQSIAHILMVPPISVSSAMGIYKSKGSYAYVPMGLSALGFTDAPASAKRSEATNVAYHIRRQEYKGRQIGKEDMEVKDDLKRAMYAYQRGDKSIVQKMLSEGTVSTRQFQNALARIPLVDGKRNPLYKGQLLSALKSTTIEGSLDTWKYMSDKEKNETRGFIYQKYSNMMNRQDRSPETKKEITARMKELGVLK
jgi:hypothetical protein